MTIDEHLQRGEPQDYELVEQMILSDQIDAPRLSEIFETYPAFDVWLRERASWRRAQIANR